jgi:3-phosphoshikimate 1-carboxyvinyltransferase
MNAVVRPPGSKSQTIRALFVAGLADGESRILHPLEADDTTSARGALRRLGVGIEEVGATWVVRGTGGRLDLSAEPIDAGASGLTGRSLIAIAPLVDGTTTVVGRDRLPERPMSGLVAALRDLGVEVSDRDGCLPVSVLGTGIFPGGSVTVSCAETTQFLTALLMVAPLAAGPLTLFPTDLVGSRGYVDMTLEVMAAFGVEVSEEDGYRVEPTGYRSGVKEVEPDASAAVYPMVAAAITGGRVTIEGLGSTSLQPDLAIARVLETMGCQVSIDPSRLTLAGPTAGLGPVVVDLSGAPDGALAVATACLFADGPSTLSGLGSLRLKESDRLEAMAGEIRRLGAGAEVESDSLRITPAPLHPTRVETHQDHRLAMSLSLVGLVQSGIEVADPAVVGKTWPGFWDMLEGLG